MAAGTLKPAIARANCDVDADLPRALPVEPRPRVSDWVLTGLVVSETAFLAYMKLRSRFNKVRS